MHTSVDSKIQFSNPKNQPPKETALSAVQSPQSQLDRRNNTAIDYLGRILERHNDGDSENDIRDAFRDFTLRTGIIDDEREIKTEVPPATDTIQRVDMYARNTYIEFKRNLIVNGRIDPRYTEQLDGYLLASVKAGWGIQNGILTDGKHFLKRNIGESILPIARNNPHTYDRPTQGPHLKNYLFDIINTDADNIAPSPETLTKHLAGGSDLLNQATALLKDAHDANRDNPTVAVKRKLWQDLLEVALGQDSTGDPNDADWLFIRHTYLTTLIALILQAHFRIDIIHEADHAPASLLNGETLHAHTNLKGVIESDLFQWPAEIGATQYIRSIARKVAQFDWSKRPDELAAVLYQNTITPEERRKMGEYYTPRWLAKTIVQELITDPQDTVAMDPACGSGTFIECLVRNIIEHSHAQHPIDTLRKLQTNVIGIDLHPVAVQLAKATWVLNSHEVINAARYADHENDIAPPIYLGDSLQLRYERNVLTRPDHITLRTTEQMPGETDTVAFDIPMSLARESDRFDPLLLDLAQAVVHGTNTDAVLDQHQITDAVERDTMTQTADQMRELQAIDRNHVWAYYLRNMVRPAVISEERVDAIVGNPPWLTYSRSADIVREEMVNLSQNTYGIWAGGRQAPNQDIATLFFTRVTDLYLKPDGKIGMVLPHSVLRSGQHLKWRNGYWQSQVADSQHDIVVDFGVKTPYDLDNLEPNDFFPIASAVVFAQARDIRKGSSNINRQPLAPGRVEIWRGPTDTPQVTRNVETLHHDDGEFHSPYADIAMEGPPIRDRRLFMVSVEPNRTFMATLNTFRTYPRRGALDKKKYDVDVLDGNVVHDENLFDVYLGESVAPYVTLSPLIAALPVDKPSMTLPLDHSSCPAHPKTGTVRHNACVVDTAQLDTRMRSRWNKMETLWEANKSQNERKSLYQNINYFNKLTSQLGWMRNPDHRPIRIAYTTSGEPTAAIIADDKAVLDETLYQVTCLNLDEAYYLLAIINSDTLASSVNRFMPKGLFGARHLHKHLWKLPIPEFDPNNTDHADLSVLGTRAATEAEKVIAGLGDPLPSVTKARSVLRHEWQPNSVVAQGIEAAVQQLLS